MSLEVQCQIQNCFNNGVRIAREIETRYVHETIFLIPVPKYWQKVFYFIFI